MHADVKKLSLLHHDFLHTRAHDRNEVSRQDYGAGASISRFRLKSEIRSGKHGRKGGREECGMEIHMETEMRSEMRGGGSSSPERPL